MSSRRKQVGGADGAANAPPSPKQHSHAEEKGVSLHFSGENDFAFSEGLSTTEATALQRKHGKNLEKILNILKAESISNMIKTSILLGYILD